MNNNDSNSTNDINSIQFKVCPKCKTIIRLTKSLNTYIQASIRDVEQVKNNIWGKPEENEQFQSKLHKKIDDVLKNESFWNDPLCLKIIYKTMHKDTDCNKPKPKQLHMLMEISNKFDLIEKLRSICGDYEGRPTQQTNISTEILDRFEIRLRLAREFILQFKNCEQQRSDISTEMSFLELMNEAIVISSARTFEVAGKKLLETAFKVTEKYGPNNETEFKALMEKAGKYADGGLSISLKERKMILQAMAFKPGHWYKCSKGHVYAIGDCGGAMEVGNCPECGELIGGTDHRLITANAVATEMDGSVAPAWPQ